MPRNLESAVEQAITDYASGRGMISLKLNVHGRIGWPDKLFLYQSVAFFIEFKREGELPRKAQLYVHKLIRAQGFEVFVVDNVNDGKEVIDGQVRLSQVRT